MWHYGRFSHFSLLDNFLHGGVISTLIWTLIILGFVFLAIKLIGGLKSGQISDKRDRFDSLEILKVRYARDEISQEDYIRMKKTLEQPY